MNAREIIQHAGDMRRASREYCSNAYFTVPQLEQLLLEKTVTVFAEKDLILLIEDEQELHRIYFFAENAVSIAKIPFLLPDLEKPVIADIVGREQQVQPTVEQLTNLGFAPYSKFVRMICRNPILPSDKNAERVELAANTDIPAIERLLKKTFDPLFAHLPTYSELEAAVGKQEITVIRDMAELIGFAFFEKSGLKQKVLRFFVVDSRYHGQNIGGALLYHQFRNSLPETSYLLWVGTYNNAQSLYLKYNFQYDGLTDYILKYGGN